MKKRILFVDDEPQVLQGLRRMLHSQVREWELHFAPGGAEALELMAATPIDVIVSDMRMPGMNGVRLLGVVKERYPGTARVALSGHMDDRMILDSTKVVHQYLTKPCSADMLVSVIRRILALRQYLSEPSLRCLASTMERIPSLPKLYLEVQEELNSPHMSIKKVGEIISTDLGMSAKVLQLVNSSFFGLFTKVTSPVQAVNLLGTRTIEALILYVHVFSQYDTRHCPNFSLSRLSQHGFGTGALAKSLAVIEKAPQEVVIDAFLAGFFHDVGQVLFAVNYPELYNELLTMVQDRQLPLWETEQEVLGANHAQLGAYLMGLWGMSEPVIEAIAFHHCPNLSTAKHFTPLTALHAAEVLDSRLHPLDRVGGPIEFDTAYIKGCKLWERIGAWEDKARELFGLAECDADQSAEHAHHEH
jgi:HD-like signal output (HDOD) protein/CheY-like chemotaxis protein